MRDFIRQSWNRVLRETVSRNGRVSLRKSFDGDEAQAPSRFASRLLGAAVDGSMLIQRPVRAGAAALCQPDARVDLILPDDQQCWAGRCTVLGTQAYALNRQKVVQAVRLSAAQRVWSAQRRRYFRVHAAGGGIETVYVIPTGTLADTAPLPIGDEDKAAGCDGFEAMVHDISGNGLGLRIDARSDLAYWLHPGLNLRCIFRLPDDPQPLDIPARLMRTARVENHLLHLGVGFALDDPIAQSRLEDRITRFTTRLERDQLQRRRGA